MKESTSAAAQLFCLKLFKTYSQQLWRQRLQRSVTKSKKKRLSEVWEVWKSVYGECLDLFELSVASLGEG